MNQQRWVAMAAALGMMAASGWWLNRLEGMQILGPAGVKVGAARIFDERTNLAATIGVLLPTNIPGYQCAPGPITQEELRTLPQEHDFWPGDVRERIESVPGRGHRGVDGDRPHEHSSTAVLPGGPGLEHYQ